MSKYETILRREEFEFNQVAFLFNSVGIETNFDYLNWRYNQCFDQSCVQVLLICSEKVVGHAMVFGQRFRFKEQSLRAAQLGDLVVAEKHRSLVAVRKIYSALDHILSTEGYDFVFTLPNERSELFNKRFLGLETKVFLETRALLANPFTKVEETGFGTWLSSDIEEKEVVSVSAKFDIDNQSIIWEACALINRLKDPTAKFGIVGNSKGMMVFSPRIFRGIPFSLVMGIWPLQKPLKDSGFFHSLLGRAARISKNPLFITVGDHAVSKRRREFSLPKFMNGRLRPVQVRVLNPELNTLSLSSLQPIDTDIF